MGGQPSGLTSVLDLINMAGRYLVGMTRWRYLEGVDYTLGTTASQSYITLPTNFASAVSLVGMTENIVAEWVDRDAIAQMRASGSSTPALGVYYVAISYAVPAVTDPPSSSAPVARLELYPTPSATSASVFRLVYRAGWADLTGDDQYVPVPPNNIETLFLQILAAFGRGSHREETGTIDERLAAQIVAGPIYRAALKEDKTKQVDHGYMRGALSNVAGLRDPLRPSYFTISGP